MSTMKSVYAHYYSKLIQVLPMEDAIFMGQLFTGQFLPGDTKATIAAKETRAKKATFFLDDQITPSFKDDGSSQEFLNLLDLMMNTDFTNLKSLAQEIKSKIAVKGIV